MQEKEQNISIIENAKTIDLGKLYETVTKALACCQNSKDECDDTNCPYFKHRKNLIGADVYFMMCDVRLLIRRQHEKIIELETALRDKVREATP